MKTLHSLTSRKPMIRVVFQKPNGCEGNKVPSLAGGVDLHSEKTILETCKKALRALAVVAGLSGLSGNITLAEESKTENTPATASAEAASSPSSAGTVVITLIPKTQEESKILKERLAPGIDGATITSENQTPSIPEELRLMGEQTITIKDPENKDGADRVMTLKDFHGLSDGEKMKFADSMTDNDFTAYEKYQKLWNNLQAKNIEASKERILTLDQKVAGKENVVATLDQKVAGKENVVATLDQEIYKKEQMIINGYREYILRFKMGDKNMDPKILDEIIQASFVPDDILKEAIKLKGESLKTASL